MQQVNERIIITILRQDFNSFFKQRSIVTLGYVLQIPLNNHHSVLRRLSGLRKICMQNTYLTLLQTTTQQERDLLQIVTHVIAIGSCYINFIVIGAIIT